MDNSSPIQLTSPLILPTRFCPTAAYYAAIVNAVAIGRMVIIDNASRFDKREKDAHRCRIADTHGFKEITAPVAKPYGATWAQTAVSRHGQWWETAIGALESAYGRTPFFEFYAPELLLPIRRGEFTSVSALNAEMNREILRCIGIDRDAVRHEELSTRKSVMPTFIADKQPVYWQIRQDKFGFIAELSILDLLFNLGPESLLYLRDAANKIAVADVALI